jgi:hypothetical protein
MDAVEGYYGGFVDGECGGDGGGYIEVLNREFRSMLVYMGKILGLRA